ISRLENGRWQAPQALSSDGWEIAACPVNGPAIAAHGDLVAVAWFTAARNSPIVKARLSKNGGKTFGETIIVDTGRPLGHVDVAYIGDSSFAISYMKNGDGLHDILLRSLTSEGELSLYKTAGRTAVAHNVPQMVEHDGNLVMAWTDRIKDESRIGTVSIEIIYAE
ncbi:MAG: sialidase family protein, partial [Woeseiaceae bacterium]|nr:sialidase family protein [Woeseiaceae bacterium]